MLKLDRHQMDQFRERNARGFERRMLAHVTERFPQASALMGSAGAEDVIRKGLAYAALHGIVKEKEVCRLIELMCALGEGTSPTPDDAWVIDILDHVTPQNISARLEQLGQLAAERLAQPSSSSDQSLRQEGAAALSAPDRPFDDRAAVEAPVTPCPAGPGRKRLCSFSS